MSKRDKSQEREVIDCLEAIKALPAAHMDMQSTASYRFGGYLSVKEGLPTSAWEEALRRISPFHAYEEDIVGRADGYPVYKIGKRLFRVSGYHDIERLSGGEWTFCDTYRDKYWAAAEKALSRAWNKRRREAKRSLKGQTKKEAVNDKKAKKLMAQTEAKMDAAMKATELRDELNEFLAALEGGTLTHAQCSNLYDFCTNMSRSQKELRRVMGVVMPKE